MLGGPHQPLYVPLDLRAAPSAGAQRIKTLSPVLPRFGLLPTCQRTAAALPNSAATGPTAVQPAHRGPHHQRRLWNRSAAQCVRIRSGRMHPVASAIRPCAPIRRNLRVLDDQLSRQDARGNLGIAEMLEQTPHVSIDRLRPDAFARSKYPLTRAARFVRRARRHGKRSDRPRRIPLRRSLLLTASGETSPLPRAPSGPRIQSVPAQVKRLAIQPLARVWSIPAVVHRPSPSAFARTARE